MRKNNLINLAVSAAIALAASFSLSSCEDILGEWDRSTPDLFPNIGKNEVTITKTATGASVTVNAPSDITNLLASVTSDIAAKGSSEYVFDVTNGGVKSTGSDNTITVPKVSGSNINLVFEKGINTESTLVIKASETASSTPTTAVNKLTITMPDGTTSLNLVIDMPETSVTVKTASGSAVYEGIVANTATNTLIIESGVTVKNLQVKGGRVVVKDGGTIETYVHASDGRIIYLKKEGVMPKYLPGVTSDGQEDWENPIFEISNEQGEPYYCQNLKVIKGSEEYTRLEIFGDFEGAKFKKLMIGDGAAVNFGNTDFPNIETIEGEGNARILYGVSYLDFNDNETMRYFGYINFEYVQNLSGVSCSPLWKDKVVDGTWIGYIPENTKNCSFEAQFIGYIGYGAKNCTFNALNEIYGISDGAEDCSYTADNWISFNTPEKSSASFKGCKFNLLAGQSLHFEAPAQTSSIPSFTWTFTNCEFSSNIHINGVLNSSIPRYDEKGNRVYMDEYNYWVSGSWTDDEGEHIYWYVNSSTDFNDVPQEAKDYGEVDDNQFWNGENHSGYMLYKDQPQYDPVEFNNYVARFAFEGCKTGSSAITSANFPCNDIYWVPDGAKLYYTIEGEDYEPQWEGDNTVILVKPNAGTRGAYNRANQRYVKPIFHQIPKRHKSPTRNQSVR